MSQDPYDELDLLYRVIWGTSLHHGYWIEENESPSAARENLIKLALSLLQPQGFIADIGCGYGILAHRLIEEFNCQILANTASKVQQESIESHPSLTVLGGDWLEADLPPESLDGAIAIESLSHFPSFDDFLEKTANAMKPGAKIIIADWFSETGHLPLLQHLAKSGDLPSWRPVSDLKKAAENGGLGVIQIRDLSSGVAPTWSHLFRSALTLPLRKPRRILQISSQLLRRPSLLWAFPLLRLAYKTGDLEYHIMTIEK